MPFYHVFHIMGASMAFIEIQRRCHECEKSRTLLREVRADIEQIRLDYHSLYEKVRTNLAKLAKRDEPDSPSNGVDAFTEARRMLIQKKLGRG